MLAVPVVASAHVETDPGQAAKGDDATITFRVPNEETTAGVVKLEVTFPADHPVAEARTTPIPGWTAKVATAPLPKPVHQNNSDVTEAVTTITWTANPGTQIAPGEFLRFSMLAGPMPDTTDQLLLPAKQTYSNDDVVTWDAPPAAAGAPDPEHPAPLLKLTAKDDAGAAKPAAPSAAPSSSTDATARWLGGIGLAAGVLALGIALGAALRKRSKPTGTASE
ncbi:YcnI family copper-binding membrane protein [Solihabitans fulvus]|nr:YcnI family protein [Solihabitans fulvus]